MVFVPALGVAQCELRMLLDGQRVENILYFYLGTSPTDSQFSDCGQTLMDWWETYMAPQLTTAIALREVYVTDLSSATSPTFTVLPESPISGTRSVTSLPSGSALTVSFRTNGRGRSSRGRNYIGGLAVADVSESYFLNSRAQSVVDQYAGLIFGAAPTALGEWVVLSRYANKAPRTAALRQRVTGVTVTDLAVDSQRRRLPTRGI